MSKGSILAKNTFILSVGNVLSKGIYFVLIVLVSRWLPVDAYGSFDVVCTYVTLLLPILSLSTGEAMFRFSLVSKTDEERSAYITNGFLLVICNVGFFLLVTGILCNVGVVAVSHIHEFIFLLIAQLINYYLQAFLRAIKRLKLYALENIAFTIMVILFSVTFVRFLGYGLTGLIYAYAVGYMITNIYIIISARLFSFISVKTISGAIVRQMIRYSLPLVPNDIAWWVLNVSDRQVILTFLGAMFNGIYAIANKIPSLCTSIFSVFSISWQQSIVEEMERGEWKDYANQTYNQLLRILLTLCSCVLSITFLLYAYIFDRKYALGMQYTPILMTAIVFSSSMQFFGGIQIALKKTFENGITNVTGAVVNLAIDLALIRYVGVYAAAISTLIANMTAAILRRYRLRGVIHFQIDKKTFCCILIYGYFIAGFYLFRDNMAFEWLNVLLSVLFFILINYQFVRSFLCKGNLTSNENNVN